MPAEKKIQCKILGGGWPWEIENLLSVTSALFKGARASQRRESLEARISAYAPHSRSSALANVHVIPITVLYSYAAHPPSFELGILVHIETFQLWQIEIVWVREEIDRAKCLL